MLTDDTFKLFNECPNAENAGFDADSMSDRHKLFSHSADRFCTESGHAESETFLKAWRHGDYLNEKHYEDHISFCVVRLGQTFYVMDKHDAKKLFLIK